jgi:hypothetical protein
MAAADEEMQIVAAFPDGWMSSGQISRDGTFLAVVFAVSNLINHSERDEEKV